MSASWEGCGAVAVVAPRILAGERGEGHAPVPVCGKPHPKRSGVWCGLDPGHPGEHEPYGAGFWADRGGQR